MPSSERSTDRAAESTHRRRDPPDLNPWSVWQALSRTPGVGVSLIARDGELLFVNDTSQVLFFDRHDDDYRGKTLADYHPPGFVRERLEMIRRALDEHRPFAIRHIYHGRRIHSVVWPIEDSAPPHDRVLTVSLRESGRSVDVTDQKIETLETQYIDLGPLEALSQRELEVLVMLGHGMSVPSTAAVLHRSPHTIQRHKEAISKKLDASGQADLVAIVASVGLELSDAELTRYSTQKRPD